jgi:hypothetical protein
MGSCPIRGLLHISRGTLGYVLRKFDSAIGYKQIFETHKEDVVQLSGIYWEGLRVDPKMRR